MGFQLDSFPTLILLFPSIDYKIDIIVFTFQSFSSIQFSGMEPIGTQVEIGTSATLSCVMHGLSQSLSDSKWTDDAGNTISDNGIYTQASAFDPAAHTETMTLTINTNSMAVSDSTYLCYANTDNSSSTILSTYCK